MGRTQSSLATRIGRTAATIAIAALLTIGTVPLASTAAGSISVVPDQTTAYTGQQLCFSYTVTGTGGAGSRVSISTYPGNNYFPDVAVGSGTGTLRGCVVMPEVAGPAGIVIRYYPSFDSLPTDSGTGEVTLIPSQTADLTLTATPDSYQFGTPATATFNATSPTEGGIPIEQGSVLFYVDGTYVSSQSVRGSGATATIPQLSAGNHTLEAQYRGYGFYETKSISIPLEVTALPTTVEIAPREAVAVGDDVEFTATVAADSVPVTGGTVQFSDGTDPVGTPVPLVDGAATLTTSFSTAGTRSITAEYSGSTNFAGSTGSTPFTVDPAETLVEACGCDLPTAFREPFVITATVISPSGLTPTGDVELIHNGQTITTQTIDADGETEFTVVPDTAGELDYTVKYLGSPDFLESTSEPVTHTVLRGDTTTALGFTGDSVEGGTTVFTATVTEKQPPAPPAPPLLARAAPDFAAADTLPVASGQVRFLINGVEAQAARPVDAHGTVTFSAANSPVGTRTVTAEYTGTTDFVESAGTVTQQITAAPRPTPQPTTPATAAPAATGQLASTGATTDVIPIAAGLLALGTLLSALAVMRRRNRFTTR